jgi:hypothetical protein
MLIIIQQKLQENARLYPIICTGRHIHMHDLNGKAHESDDLLHFNTTTYMLLLLFIHATYKSWCGIIYQR